MRTIIFMRHGFLEGKYQDYLSLNFKEFEELLIKIARPQLDEHRNIEALSKMKILDELDGVICSSEERAIETARLVTEKVHLPYKSSSLIDEIQFEQGVITEEDTASHDFNQLRKKILTQVYHSYHTERFDDIKNRFLRFIHQVEQEKGTTILCITHGWFMRLIAIYARRKSLDNISLEELLAVKPSDFLGTITLELDTPTPKVKNQF